MPLARCSARTSGAGLRCVSISSNLPRPRSPIRWISSGDLEAEPEIAHDVLLAATELLATIGDVGTASELDAVRAVLSRQLQPIPAIEELHEAWLAANGVTPSRETEALGVPDALAIIREWLKDSARERVSSPRPRN